MWNKKNQMRNRLLQMQLPDYKAEAINHYVFDEFHKISDASDPVLGLRSIQPVKLKILGDDRANLAFGDWGLPKILKEICSDDSRTQICAMNTISELLLNELECQRAIGEFEIVRRLQNILLRRRRQKHKDQHLIPIILRCYGILAFNLRAALQMSKRRNLIHDFYTLSEQGEHCKICSCILRTLTQHPQVIDYFIHHTIWFRELSELLKENFIALMDLNLLEHFSHFLELYPQLAINEGFFDIILREIPERQASQQILLKCFAFLLNCKEGQDLLDKCDGVRVLYEIFMDDYLETYEYVTQALQSATACSQTSLWRCREFWNLPYALIRRAHDKSNEKQQVYCLQILHQITTVPSVKQHVRKICVPQIRKIDCRNENVKAVKDKLLVWLKSDVYNR